MKYLAELQRKDKKTLINKLLTATAISALTIFPAEKGFGAVGMKVVSQNVAALDVVGPNNDLGGAVNFVVGDGLKFAPNNPMWSVTTGVDMNIQGVDVGDPGALVINSNVSLGPVFGAGGLNLTIRDGKTLTLNGNAAAGGGNAEVFTGITTLTVTGPGGVLNLGGLDANLVLTGASQVNGLIQNAGGTTLQTKAALTTVVQDQANNIFSIHTITIGATGGVDGSISATSNAVPDITVDSDIELATANSTLTLSSAGAGAAVTYTIKGEICPWDTLADNYANNVGQVMLVADGENLITAGDGIIGGIDGKNIKLLNKVTANTAGNSIAVNNAIYANTIETTGDNDVSFLNYTLSNIINILNTGTTTISINSTSLDGKNNVNYNIGRTGGGGDVVGNLVIKPISVINPGNPDTTQNIAVSSAFNFDNVDSSLTFSTNGATQGNITGFNLKLTGVGIGQAIAGDLTGKLTLVADGRNLTVSSAANIANEKIGKDIGNRLQSLTLTGAGVDDVLDLSVPTFAKAVTTTGAGTVIINKPLQTGALGSITVKTTSVDAAKGTRWNIEADSLTAAINPTINIGDAAAGNLTIKPLLVGDLGVQGAKALVLSSALAFAHADSALTFSTNGATQGNITGFNLKLTGVGISNAMAGDVEGKLIIDANGRDLTIIANNQGGNNAIERIGEAADHRIKSLAVKASVNKKADVGLYWYAKETTSSGEGEVIFSYPGAVGAGGTFRAAAKGGTTMEIHNTSLTGAQNAAIAIGSAGDIPNLGDPAYASTLTIKPTKYPNNGPRGVRDIVLSSAVSFEHDDSILVLKFDKVTADQGNITGFRYILTGQNIGGGDDGKGSLYLQTGTNGNGINSQNIWISKAVAQKLGGDNTHRLKEVKIQIQNNARTATIDVPVYAKTLSIEGPAVQPGGIMFNQDVDLGDGGKLDFSNLGLIGNPNSQTLLFSNLTAPTIDFANKRVTLNISANGTLNVTNIENQVAAASIKFLGAGTLGAAPNIKLNNIGNVLNLNGDYADAEFTLINNGIITLAGDTILKTISGGNAASRINLDNHTLNIRPGGMLNAADAAADVVGGGTLKFTGAGTLDIKVGDNNGLTNLVIGAGAVTLGAKALTIKATNVNFTDAASQIIAQAGALTTITGDIKNTTGTKEKGKIEIVAGSPLKITGNVGAGGANDSLELIDAKENTEITRDLYVKKLAIEAGKAVTLSAAADILAEVTGDKLIIANDRNFLAGTNLSALNMLHINGDRTATFLGDITLNRVTTQNDNAAGEGTLIFQDNATLKGDIGGVADHKLKLITFTAGKKYNLDAVNLRSIDSTIAGTFDLNGNATFTGNQDVNGATFNLGQHSLTLGKVTFNGNNIINLTTDKGGVTGGLTSTGDMDKGGGAKVNISLDNHLESGNFNNIVVLSSATALNLDVADITLNTTNAYRTASFKKDANRITVTTKENTRGAILNLEQDVEQDRFEEGKGLLEEDSTLLDPKELDLERYYEIVESLPSLKENTAAIVDREEFLESIQRLVVVSGDSVKKSGVLASSQAAAHNVSNVTSQVLNARILKSYTAKLNNPSFAPVRSAVAAGDGDPTGGAWVSPIYGKSTQEKNETIAGFKSTNYGIIAGLDHDFGDKLTMGVAAGYIGTDVKHKNYKIGDKTRIGSYIFSLYSLYNFDRPFFLSTNTSFVYNYVKNKEKRIGSSGGNVVYELAKARYNIRNYGIEITGGYSYVPASRPISITPTLGFAYTRNDAFSYKERGTTAQNLDVESKAYDKYETIVGLSLSGFTEAYNAEITPTLRTSVRTDLKPNKSKVLSHLNGVPLNVYKDPTKPPRNLYNLGIDLSASIGSKTFKFSLDYNRAKKFKSYQGSANVRIDL